MILKDLDDLRLGGLCDFTWTGKPEIPPGGIPRRAFAHGAWSGTVQRNNMVLGPPPPCGPTTPRSGYQGRVQCEQGSRQGLGSGCAICQQFRLALATWNLISLVRKVPELKNERFQLDIVGLNISGVSKDERQLAGVGMEDCLNAAASRKVKGSYCCLCLYAKQQFGVCGWNPGMDTTWGLHSSTRTFLFPNGQQWRNLEGVMKRKGLSVFLLLYS